MSASDGLAQDTATISCVSFEPVFDDKRATLDRMLADVQEAAAGGADLVVFPEGALSSWTWCDGCLEAGGPCDWHLRSVAEPADGPTTAALAAACRDLQLHIVYGFVEAGDRSVDGAARLHNSIALVGPDGLVDTYRKIHLGALPGVTEGLTFTPGDRIPVWELPFGKIGASICFDFWYNPEIPRIQALKGAQVLVNPTATMPAASPDDIVAGTRARVRENLCFVAVANLAGRPGDPNGDVFAGRSMIAGPSYPSPSVVLAKGGEEPGIVTATVDLREADRWAETFPWREWRAGRLAGASQLIADEFARLRP